MQVTTPRTAKGARQYASLLEAATTLFAERGYQGASLQDIASSLGLIKASVYHYVSSKDDLLFAILDATQADFRDNLADAKVTSADTEETLRAFVEGHLRIVLARQPQLRIFERDFDHLSDGRRLVIAAQREEYGAHFRDLIETYVHGRRPTSEERRFALEATTVLAQMNVVRTPDTAPGLTPPEAEEMVQRITNLIMGGLDHLRTHVPAAPDDPVVASAAATGEKEDYMPRTVSSVLLDAYQEYADRPALREVDGSVLLTYSQLRDRALAIAGWLHSVGATPGANVVILTDNHAEFFEAEHGIFLAGCRRIALGDRLHENEVTGILKDCQPPVVFASARWAARLVEQREALDFLERIVCWDDDDPVAGTVAFSSVTTAARPAISSLPTPGEEEIAALIYTSGSTGTAKGVLLSHRAWLGMTDLTVSQLPPFGDDDTMLHVAPLSHMAGYHALPVFAHGGSHIVARKFNAAEALEAIAEFRVTTTALVPTILHELVKQQAATGADLSSLKSVIYGGARISAVQLRAAIEVFGPQLRQFYGLSEIPILSCLGAREHDPFGGDSGKYLSSAGRVLPGVELKIVDKDGTTLGPQQTGEIIARSKTSMSGYLNLADATRKTLLPGGWIRTGDVGELDDENYLYIRDRLKDVVITGGYNVYTAEVENVLAAAPGVADIAVLGIPDERWGEVLVAAVVPALGADLDGETLATFCAERIARYKIPKHFIFLDDLPVSAAGKIDRRALAESTLTKLSPSAPG